MNQPLPPAAVQALQQGRMIEAIKIVRTERNLGLKQAKDQVDQYLQQRPELSQRRVVKVKQGSTQWLMWFFGFFLLAIFAWQHWA
jgi:hypothetical protein